MFKIPQHLTNLLIYLQQLRCLKINNYRVLEIKLNIYGFLMMQHKTPFNIYSVTILFYLKTII